MSFRFTRDRITASVFARFGDDAQFVPQSGDPVIVRVILAQPDQLERLGLGEIITSTCVFRMERRRLRSPVGPATLYLGELLPDGSFVRGDEYDLVGDAVLDRRGQEWTWGAEFVPPSGP